MSDKKNADKKADATPADAKGRPAWMMPALAAVVALGAGVATAFTPLGGASAGGASAAEHRAPAEEEATGDGAEFGEFMQMESLVVNPQGSGGRSYLMLQIGAEAATPETIERLKTISPAANDAVLDLLSHKTADELGDITQRDALKEELRTALNGLLGHEGPVRRIYFIQYVLQ